ncbi:sugar transferase [Bacillus sp. B190/17]|uniref:Sugar transferase n=1 Tax=Bacillus lumedeiriae TaxID=3058829 RepID=A0ABW8IBM4_9BACI
MNEKKQELLHNDRANERKGKVVRKRVFDLFISIILLIVSLPIMLMTGMFILLIDGRPIFFKQIRTGQYGRPFLIWKFRTMKVHDSESDHQYRWAGGVPNDFVFKTSENSHVTKLGSFLRKYSLDELPQLINVLRGEMSIVGPRPEIPAVTSLYNNEQRRRLNVKPGITGYAQINGRSAINHGKKMAYDLYYVQNCSIGLDVKIIVKTAIQVIRSKGAY